MRLKISSLLATAALALSACDSCTDECLDASGQGALAAAEAAAAAEACVPGTVADFVDNVGDRVFFDFDRSTVRPDGMDTLQRQAAWLNTYSNYVVTVNGHCDKRGTTEYNLALGQRRADSTYQFLRGLGVAPERMRTVSYGEERPADPRSNEEAWA